MVCTGTFDQVMTQHLATPDRPVLCCQFSQWQALRAICALSWTMFHHNLPAPDSIRGFLKNSACDAPCRTQKPGKEICSNPPHSRAVGVDTRILLYLIRNTAIFVAWLKGAGSVTGGVCRVSWYPTVSSGTGISSTIST